MFGDGWAQAWSVLQATRNKQKLKLSKCSSFPPWCPFADDQAVSRRRRTVGTTYDQARCFAGPAELLVPRQPASTCTACCSCEIAGRRPAQRTSDGGTKRRSVAPVAAVGNAAANDAVAEAHRPSLLTGCPACTTACFGANLNK